MIVFGIIMILTGSISYIYGNQLNNSMEMQIKSLLENGTTDPGSIFIAIGIIGMVIGLIFVVIGIAKSFQNTSHLSKGTCPHCGKQIVADASFCTQCGNKVDW